MAVRLVVRRATARRLASESDHGEISYEFEQPRLVIGRSASADVRLPALTVSELHATLERTERGYSLRDEGSTNGTRVNGSCLVPGRARTLNDGDELELGEFVLEFSQSGPVRGLTSPERTVSLAKRMLAEASEQPPEASRLLWEVAGRPMPPRALPHAPARWLLGRDPSCELVVDDPDVSRQQLELVVDLDGVRVRDLDSKNGLTINGKAMRERVLHDGDCVQFGNSVLWLDDPAERALRALEGQADVAHVATEPAVRAPSSDASRETLANTPEAPAEPEAPSTAEDARAQPSAASTGQATRSFGPDAIIYALAGSVLVASVAGLLWLLAE